MMRIYERLRFLTALATGTFIPKSSSYENASSTPRFSRLDRQSPRWVSSERVKSLPPRFRTGRRTASGGSSPRSRTADDTKHVVEEIVTQLTCLTKGEQRGDRQEQKKAVAASRNDRISGTSQEQEQRNRRTPDRDVSPQHTPKARRSEENAIHIHTRFVQGEHRTVRDLQRSNEETVLEETVAENAQTKQASPRSRHDVQPGQGKDDGNDTPLPRQKTGFRSISAKKLRELFSPTLTDTTSSEKETPTYSDSIESTDDVCPVMPRRNSAQRHRSCVESASHAKPDGRHGASASASDGTFSRTTHTVTFERKPFVFARGPVQPKATHARRSERPAVAPSQLSPASNDASDVGISLQIASLECFSGCKSIRASKDRSHPSGADQPRPGYREDDTEEKAQEDEQEPLTNMQLFSRKLESPADSHQKARRHSSRQMDTRSSRSRSLSPVKEEHLTSARRQRHGKVEFSVDEEKEKGGEEGVLRREDGDVTAACSHRQSMEAREGQAHEQGHSSQVTIKIPGITLHSRDINGTRASGNGTSWSFRGHFTVTSSSLYGHIMVTLWSLHGHFRDTSRSLRGHLTITSWSLHGHFTVTSLSLHGHFMVVIAHTKVLNIHRVKGVRVTGRYVSTTKSSPCLIVCASACVYVRVCVCASMRVRVCVVCVCMRV